MYSIHCFFGIHAKYSTTKNSLSLPSKISNNFKYYSTIPSTIISFRYNIEHIQRKHDNKTNPDNPNTNLKWSLVPFAISGRRPLNLLIIASFEIFMFVDNQKLIVSGFNIILHGPHQFIFQF